MGSAVDDSKASATKLWLFMTSSVVHAFSGAIAADVRGAECGVGAEGRKVSVASA